MSTMDIGMTEEEMGAGVEAMARDVELEQDNLFAQLAPRGQFGAEALNGVVFSLNNVLSQMGILDPYPEFEAGERVLPGDMVRALAMVAEASEVAGIDPVSLENVTDDTDLNLLAGKLQSIADDTKFAEAMSAPSEDVVVEEEALPAGQPAIPGGEEVVEETDDALFMSRM
jgi:hypothetical protein